MILKYVLCEQNHGYYVPVLCEQNHGYYVPIFCVISFNTFWKFLALGNLA